MYNKPTRILALILALALLFELAPASVFATDYDEQYIESDGEEILDEELSAYVVAELEDRRDETEKHFRMSDGTFLAVGYNEPVHYQGADGEWEDIDNTMSLVIPAQNSGASVQSVMTIPADPVYEIVNGDQIRRFAATLGKDGYVFSSISGDDSIHVYVLSENRLGPDVQDIMTNEGDYEDATSTETQPLTSVEAEDEKTESSESVDAVESIDTDDITDAGAATDTAEVEANDATVEPEGNISDDAANDTEEAVEPSEPAGEEVDEPAAQSLDGIEAGASDEVANIDVDETADVNPTDVVAETDETAESSDIDTESEDPVEIFGDNEVAELVLTDMLFAIREERENIQIQASVQNPEDTVEIMAYEDRTETPISEQTTPAKLESHISYEDAWPGVDLEYIPHGFHVKEALWVKEPLSEYEFSFFVASDSLIPVENDDGSISWHDMAGNVLMEIPAPYIIDAAGEASYDVHYTLTKAAGGYIMTVTADKEWMNDPERMYPIMIDPTIYTEEQGSGEHIITTYVNSRTTAVYPHNRRQFVCVGQRPASSNDGGDFVGLVYVNKLPALPNGSIIVSSYLNLFLCYYSNRNDYSYPRVYSSVFNGSYTNIETYLNNMTWSQFTNDVVYGGNEIFEDKESMDYVRASYDPIAYENGTRDSRYLDTYWQITPAVQNWYSANSTVSRLLVLRDGSDFNLWNTDARATYAGYKHDTHKPQIVIQYRDTTGVEGIYDYHTQSIGRAGTASVNNLTLNLSLSVPLVSAPSEVLPFSLGLVYNTNHSDNYFTGRTFIKTKSFNLMQLAYGWKLTAQQTVVSETLSGDNSTTSYFLVYTDADGTQHYFSKKSSTEYEDEDGLGLTITVNNPDNPTVFTMKDKETNTWSFENGFIVSYKDHNGNALYYAYNGHDYTSDPQNTSWKPNATNNNQLTSVWRRNNGASEEKLVTINYHETNGHILSVVDRAGRTTSFTYSDHNLSQITYPDGATANYTYANYERANPMGGSALAPLHLLTAAIDNESGYKVTYTYRNRLGSYRVKDIAEYAKTGSTWTRGIQMHAYNEDCNTTAFRYYGADGIANTADDIVPVYSFDDCGRLISTVIMNYDRTKILGVSSNRYTVNDSTSKKNNRLLESAATGIQGTNLLLHSGFENSDALSSGVWRKTGPGATTISTDAHTGNAAISITSNDGIAHVASYQYVNLIGGKKYVVSAYINTKNATSFTSNGGAYVTVINDNYDALGPCRKINYKTTSEINGGWERVYATVSVPSTGSYRFGVIQHGVTGPVLFDDVQMEEMTDTSLGEVTAGAPSSVNLIQGGSFETATNVGYNTSIGANAWWTVGNSCEFVSQEGHGTVAKLGMGIEYDRRVSQTVRINKPANTTFIVSAWGKAPASNYNLRGTSEDYLRGERFFGVIVRIKYVELIATEDHYLTFNPDVNDWQFGTACIVPKETSRTIDYIRIELANDRNSNNVYFDNVSLIQEPVQTYAYDDNGNLIASTNSEGKTSTEMDNKDRLVNYTNMAGVVYHLTYEGNSRNPSSVTGAGLKAEYTYDSMGNVTVTRTMEETDQDRTGPFLRASAAYRTDENYYGNYLTSATDTNGLNTTSQYNTSKGLLTSTTAPNGTVTTYSYNANNDRPTQTETVGSRVLTYTYTSGILSSVSRLGQVYSMSHTPFGQMQQITVGTAGHTPISLATYEYAAFGGNLQKMTYANGQYVMYTYDLFDRVQKERYYSNTDTLVLTKVYVYNSEGELAQQYYLAGNSTSPTKNYFYEYDSLGRLIRSREEVNGTVKQQTEHIYDTANRLVKQTYRVGSQTYTEAFNYSPNDGSLTSVSTSHIGKMENHYDCLKRLSGQTVYVGSNAIFNRQYTYADNSTTNQAVSRPSKLWYYTGSSDSGTLITGRSYSYTTDGQIRNVWDAATHTKLSKYSYDELSQLTIEQIYSDGTLQNTYSYSYDEAGNITSVEKDGTTVGTYTYGNSSWKDLLTAYNGHAIAYEGQTINSSTGAVTGTAISGNPKNWYNGTSYTDLTWNNGRQLTNLSKGSTQISYSYDMSGIRSSKVVGGVTHDYLTMNGKVMQESWGTNIMQFVYDSNGAPYALRYSSDSGTTWRTVYYILNLQGDVIRIISSSGTKYATYTYNAWGQVLDAHTSSASRIPNLAELNPLRYRGYYYDTETGFYYLQSRYYDPVVKRFINADEFASTGQGFLGYNMFAYCGNNPVNLTDPTGTWGLSAIFTAIVVAAAVVAVGAMCVATAGIATSALAVAGGAIANTAVVSAATAVAVEATEVAIAAGAAATLTKTAENRTTRTYSVYFLEDQNGTIQYVGRVTDEGLKQRLRYHEATRGLTLAYSVSGLSYYEARGLEEIGMIECHTLNPGKPVNNQIHGISSSNKKGEQYMGSTLSYLDNKAENILLNILTMQ